MAKLTQMIRAIKKKFEIKRVIGLPEEACAISR